MREKFGQVAIGPAPTGIGRRCATPDSRRRHGRLRRETAWTPRCPRC